METLCCVHVQFYSSYCHVISDNVLNTSLCSGAEFLLQVFCGSLPLSYFEPLSSISASEVAVHILDSLYARLDEACLVQGGQVVPYVLFCNRVLVKSTHKVS